MLYLSGDLLLSMEGESVDATKTIHRKVVMLISRSWSIHISLYVGFSLANLFYPYIYDTLQLICTVTGEGHEPGEGGVDRIYFVDKADGTVILVFSRIQHRSNRGNCDNLSASRYQEEFSLDLCSTNEEV